jgi:hypothetical protein
MILEYNLSESLQMVIQDHINNHIDRVGAYQFKK